MKRRNFIKKASVTSLGIVAGTSVLSGCDVNEESNKSVVTGTPVRPLVIATWNTPDEVEAAANVLANGGTALEAVEQGCRVAEANEKGQSVGKGGLPDRDGNVTLDACIMNEKGDYGAVVAVKEIKHVISLARKVMEDTPHVLLAGEGAKQFALEVGFKAENLLTEASKKAWEKWKKQRKIY